MNSNTECLILVDTFRLAPGGIAALVLPNGIFNSPSSTLQETPPDYL